MKIKLKLLSALIEFLLVVGGFILVANDVSGIWNAIGVFIMIFGNNFNGRNS